MLIRDGSSYVFSSDLSLPLLNTLILLCSGTTITWAQHSLIHCDREGLKKGLWLTIILGAVFSAIQAYEYAHAPFGFGQSNYSSAFYMAPGFHGFHVLVATLFLPLRLSSEEHTSELPSLIPISYPASRSKTQQHHQPPHHPPLLPLP